MLVLLDKLSPQLREQMLFLFSRVWHLRNNVIFGNGRESISGSVNFVVNFWSSFSSSHVTNKMMSIKGKEATVKLW